MPLGLWDQPKLKSERYPDFDCGLCQLTRTPERALPLLFFEDQESQQAGLKEINQVLSGFTETHQTRWKEIDAQILAFADNDWQDLHSHHK